MPLKLRRHSRSNRWYLRGTIRGISVDESTGTNDREAAEQIRIIREAQLLRQSIYGVEATTTFLEAAVGYLTDGGEARFLGRFNEQTGKWTGLIGHFGTTPISKIDQSAIDSAARQLLPNAKPATHNRQIYTPLSAVISWAATRNLTPVRRIARPRQPRGRLVWLKPNEVERLLAATAPHLKPLLIFLFGTGARVGEAVSLTWDQVDLQAKRVTFVDTKNGEHRGVPLNSRVLSSLANLPHRIGAVFRRPDGEAYATKDAAGGQIKTAFAGACRRAGLKDVTPHTCRHTWASWYYMETRDLRGLMELGGWKSERMVVRYTHVNPDHLAEAVEKLPWAKVKI